MIKPEHPFFQNSKCLNSWLHRFEIKAEYPQGVMEVCEICKKKKFFRLIEGKVDNANYMSWHIRLALPTFHPLYEREFPKLEDNGIESPYA